MRRGSRLALSAAVLAGHLLPAALSLALPLARRPAVRRPLLASYKLTYRCNLRCRQCPFPGYSAPDPSFLDVQATLERIAQRGSRMIVFEGGEPLLWHDGPHTFADVAHIARQQFAVVGVTTNGTLPLDAPVDLLWVSLDGFAETHNRLRQAPIFAQVIDNIRQSPHPRLYAHITANRENASEVPELVRFLAGIVKGITVQLYYPYGTDDQLLLPEDARRALLDRLLTLKQEGYPLLNSAAGLRALRDRSWRCLPWLVDCANPDGSLRQGCYLQDRVQIDCQKCGFSPYTEISLAFRGSPSAILGGLRTFC